MAEEAASDAAAAQQRLGGLETALAKRMAGIEALQERFMSELAAQWDAYGQEYSQLEEARAVSAAGGAAGLTLQSLLNGCSETFF